MSRPVFVRVSEYQSDDAIMVNAEAIVCLRRLCQRLNSDELRSGHMTQLVLNGLTEPLVVKGLPCHIEFRIESAYADLKRE